MTLAGSPYRDSRGNPRRARIDPGLVGLKVLGWIEGDEATAEAWRGRSSWSSPGHAWVLATQPLLAALAAEWRPWDGADHELLGVAPKKRRVPHLARRRR